MTTSDLAKQLDAVGRSKTFDGITIFPTTAGNWQAATRRAGSDGWHVGIAPTISEALNKALAGQGTEPEEDDEDWKGLI